MQEQKQQETRKRTGLENVISKAKTFASSLGNKLKSAIPLGAAIAAPYLTSQPTEVYAQSNSESTTNAPIVFSAESRNLNDWITRHFNKKGGSAGQGIIFTVYANNTLSSNIVGGIEFDLEYPTNNVRYLYAVSPSSINGYIQSGYGINQTNDLFFGAQMSQINQTGLTTRRFVSSGTEQSQLINQSNPGEYPIAMFNFVTYPTNQAGFCSFNIKNTKAYDLNGNEIPSTGTHMSVNIIDDWHYYEDVLGKTSAIMIDMNEIQGKKIPFIFVDSYYPYIDTPFQLKKSTNVQNWYTLKESYLKSGVNYIGDLIDWSASTNDAAFYKVTK